MSTGHENTLLQDAIDSRTMIINEKLDVLITCLAANKTGAFDEKISDMLLLDLAISISENLKSMEHKSRQMSKLKPCPCGKTPKELNVTETLSGKWAEVTGDCCGEWTIEYRNGYETGEASYALAVDAWNNAPRGDDGK